MVLSSKLLAIVKMIDAHRRIITIHLLCIHSKHNIVEPSPEVTLGMFLTPDGSRHSYIWSCLFYMIESF